MQPIASRSARPQTCKPLVDAGALEPKWLRMVMMMRMRTAMAAKALAPRRGRSSRGGGFNMKNRKGNGKKGGKGGRTKGGQGAVVVARTGRHVHLEVVG